MMASKACFAAIEEPLFASELPLFPLLECILGVLFPKGLSRIVLRFWSG